MKNLEVNVAIMTTTFATRRRTRAVQALNQFFESIPDSRRLKDDELSTYQNHSFIAGWATWRMFSDRVKRVLHVLIDEDFPYVAARIAIPDRPREPGWPHFEPQGLLCLTTPDTAVDSQNPTDMVEFLLEESFELVEDCIGHRNQDDFRNEFHSYWKPSATPVTSILETRGPIRCVCIWRTKSMCVAGENSASVRAWLDNLGVNSRNGQFLEGVLLVLPKPLIPSEYPKNGTDMLRHITTITPHDFNASGTLKSVPSNSH